MTTATAMFATPLASITDPGLSLETPDASGFMAEIQSRMQPPLMVNSAMALGPDMPMMSGMEQSGSGGPFEQMMMMFMDTFGAMFGMMSSLPSMGSGLAGLPSTPLPSLSAPAELPSAPGVGGDGNSGARGGGGSTGGSTGSPGGSPSGGGGTASPPSTGASSSVSSPPTGSTGGSTVAATPGGTAATGGTTPPTSSVSSSPATGKAKDVINWAQGELKKGVNEASNQDYISSEYCKGANIPWCAAFVSTAMEKAGVKGWGYQPSVDGILSQAQQGVNALKVASTPKPGDVFINPGTHTGLVTSVKNGQITTIEGNSSDSVATRTYPASQFSTYVRPNYKTDSLSTGGARGKPGKSAPASETSTGTSPSGGTGSSSVGDAPTSRKDGTSSGNAPVSTPPPKDKPPPKPDTGK